MVAPLKLEYYNKYLHNHSKLKLLTKKKVDLTFVPQTSKLHSLSCSINASETLVNLCTSTQHSENVGVVWFTQLGIPLPLSSIIHQPNKSCQNYTCNTGVLGQHYLNIFVDFLRRYLIRHLGLLLTKKCKF